MGRPTAKAKNSKTAHCCWVRILNVRQDADEPAGKVLIEDCSAHVLDPGRPPDRIAYSANNIDGKAPECAPGFAWSAERAFLGRATADTVFDYGPVFETVAAATAWITSAEGRAWDAEAANRFLMTFEEMVSMKKANHDTTDLPKKGFPKKDWTQPFYNLHNSKPANGDKLFDPNDVAGAIDKPGDPSEECGSLLALKHLRQQPNVNRDIRTQAQSLAAAIQPVFDVLSIDPDCPVSLDWKRLIGQVADNVEPVVFQQKRKFNRKRPVHVCNDIDPMFKGGNYLSGAPQHRLYPGHPSYPSSHATMAHVWAGLLASRKPPLALALEAAADQVAHNREIAGLHFPSDSAAGKKLAQAIVEQILGGSSVNTDFIKSLKALLP